MRLHLYAVCVTVAMVLSACGGGSDSAAGASGDDGSEASASADGAGAPADGANSADSGSSSPDDGSSPAGGGDASILRFDPAALSTDPVPVAHVQGSDDRATPAPPGIEPVIDTCDALSTNDFDAIVSDVSDRYGFGRGVAFAANSSGAACYYRSDTHVIRVVVGSTDEVSTDADSPAMWLPPAAGDITETDWDSDRSVRIISEDSFGVDSAFGAFTDSGPYGVMVTNTGGTGIDDSFEGVLFASIAAAVAGNTAGVAPVSDDATSQADAVASDACSVWSLDELDDFLPDHEIRREEETKSNGCYWSGETSISLNLVSPDVGADPAWAPIEPGSPIRASDIGDRVSVETADFVVTIQIDGPYDPATDRSVPSIDAAIALAENLLARTG